MCRAVVERRLGLCAAAAAYKLSRQAAAKWVVRYRQQAGLRDRSSRPHSSPRQTSQAVEQQVIELRRGRLAGYWIARQTGLSVATVSRILRRAHQPVARSCSPASGGAL
jgi:transposase